MSRTLLCAAICVTALALQPVVLSGQGPAQALVDARHQLQIRNLDSAITLLHAMTASEQADSAEQAEAFMWLGVATYYRGTDSAATDAFKTALAYRPLLMAGPTLVNIDSVLAGLWEHEQTITLCGEYLPAWLGTTGGLPRSTPLNADARNARGPELIHGPPLLYPDDLRRAAIQGRVMVRAVVDTRGRSAGASVRVVSTVNRGFERSVIDYAQRAQFTAATSSAGRVRSCVIFPVDFRVQR